MKSNYFVKASLLIIVVALITVIVSENSFLNSVDLENEKEILRTSGAGESMDAWAYERAYPFDEIPVSKFVAAFEAKKQQEAQRSNSIVGEWESLGPENIGGRTLCLAFHPTDPDIIFAGSASGGLWKTTTQGVGRFAWEQIPTGFPVLGVAAIAVDQNDPDIIIIGTGETYGTGLAEPGTINRLTRGTYGIGILKSVDGGITWSQTLQFDMNSIKGVMDIEINGQNSSEVFAATTDGVYRSVDGGDTWSLVFANANCFDIEIDPNNGSIVYVTQGNFNNGLDPNLCGIFKSTNGGDSFTELLDPGLISAWSGNAKLVIDPTDSNILYASIQVSWFNTGATTPAGIFKSTDAGSTWANINNQNIAQFQGWYSHDIAVNPSNNSEIINAGIATWKSTDAGINFTKKSNNSWTIGEVSVEVPEGGDDYVHSDVHAVYYHPLIANKVFFATDGGVFSSVDGGENFITHNGGLQTTQYYADMGSSSTNPDFCIAGAQDNASYIYKGEPSWFRVLGGDGMSASVRPDDDQIVFGSSQGLAIRKSNNGGISFFNSQPIIGNEPRAFAAPYKIAPSNNDIMYAGASFLYKNIVGGGSVWNATSAQVVDGSNVITKIAISPFNPDIVYVATAPDPFFGTLSPKVFRSVDGGQNFTDLSTGLPNRVCKDIEFDPTDDTIIYITFSGFGSNHVFKSTNSGANWSAIDNGLPDIPTNTIVVDPINPDDIYVGNDLGVYYSENGGTSWEVFSDLLPEATMIYDLNVSPSNRKLRIATHGRGIWERDFVNDPLSVSDFSISISKIILHPNPATNNVTIEIEANNNFDIVTVAVYNFLGQKITSIYDGPLFVGRNKISWDGLNINPSGSYLIVIETGNTSISKTLIIK
ncbi:MAG: T9SS type A sorting domain-containing protein [Bacteroidetes bacterium]|nr:T9SS type A sorting domain-containing protein [Bacteroidota bacterium]